MTTKKLSYFKSRLDPPENVPTTTEKPVFSYFGSMKPFGQGDEFEVNKTFLDNILNKGYLTTKEQPKKAFDNAFTTASSFGGKNAFIGDEVKVGTSMKVTFKSQTKTSPKLRKSSEDLTTSMSSNDVTPTLPSETTLTSELLTQELSTTLEPDSTKSKPKNDQTSNSTPTSMPSTISTESSVSLRKESPLSKLTTASSVSSVVKDTTPSTFSRLTTITSVSTQLPIFSEISTATDENLFATEKEVTENANDRITTSPTSIFRLWESYAIPDQFSQSGGLQGLYQGSSNDNVIDYNNGDKNSEFSWHESSPLEPMIKGNWLEWLASKSKLKEPEEEMIGSYSHQVPNILQPNFGDGGMSDDKYIVQTSISVPNSAAIDDTIVGYIKSDKDAIAKVKQDKNDLRTGKIDENFNNGTSSFLLSDSNTRDILYVDIIENEKVAEKSIKNLSDNGVQIVTHTPQNNNNTTDNYRYDNDITDQEVTYKSLAANGDSDTNPDESYQEVVNQNNKLVDILKSTLEMQAYLLDRVVAFFVNK